MKKNSDQQAQIESIKASLDRPVVLIGMMGSGKSRVGRSLAKALDVHFYDSDSIIEEKAGRPVSEIFESFGEKKFRQSEHRTVIELLNKGPCVVATGGGAPANPDTLKAIKGKSLSVWLDSSVETLVKRLGEGKSRPLLRGKDQREVLNELLEARKLVYAQADIRIDSGQDSLQSTVGRLIKTLSEYIKSPSPPR